MSFVLGLRNKHGDFVSFAQLHISGGACWVPQDQATVLSLGEAWSVLQFYRPKYHSIEKPEYTLEIAELR